MILPSQRRVYQGIAFFLLFWTQLATHANTLYPLDTAKQDAQFTHLLRELRSDDEVIHYLTARYGDFILFKPPVKGITALLWFGPAIFMLIGILIFWRTCSN